MNAMQKMGKEVGRLRMLVEFFIVYDEWLLSSQVVR
jgi:hypothetical protein